MIKPTTLSGFIELGYAKIQSDPSIGTPQMKEFIRSDSLTIENARNALSTIASICFAGGITPDELVQLCFEDDDEHD